MGKEFIKEFNISDNNLNNSYHNLLKNIQTVKKNIESDYQNIGFVKSQELVDYYTYKIKSEEAKYAFLLKEAKKLETGMYI